MRILAIYRHYWPDTTPYARLLKEILESLARDGHSVTVYTAQPSYNDLRQPRQPWKQSVNGVNVLRFPLLPERKWIRPLWGLNLLLFLTAAVLRSFFTRRFDLVIANTHPPLLMGATLRVIHALTGIPYIYHCQDLHPETLLLSGTVATGYLFRFLQRIDATTCEKALSSVVLSRDMVETLRQRGQNCNNIEVINNFPLGRYSEVAANLSPELRHPGPDKFRIAFTGNLGRFQGLERLIEAAHLLREHEDIQFVFMGQGDAKTELIQLSGDLLDRSIHFLPYQPVETAFAFLETSDLGIVSLRRGMYRMAFPSKCMMYLAAGCPLLAVIESDSELAQTVESHHLGYVSENHNAHQVASAILKARAESANWTPQRRNELRARGEALYGQEHILDKWRLLLKKHFAEPTPTPIASFRNEPTISQKQEAA